MTRHAVGPLLLSAVIVSGCAHHPAPVPSLRTLELGTLHASYNDYADLPVCDADPVPLSRELGSLNRLLAQFLDSTSAGAEGQWSAEQVKLLQSAPGELPPFLTRFETVLQKARGCDFPRELGMGDTFVQGTELARQARGRIAEAPGLLPRILAHQALEAWREAQVRERATARQETCRSRARRPQLYYAMQTETGRREYLFCDGTRALQAREGSPPQLTNAQGEALRARSSSTQGYLDALKRFPEAQVQRAPKVPAPAP